MKLATFLHCRLPDSLGERGIYEKMRYIDILLANRQVTHIFRGNDDIYNWK